MFRCLMHFRGSGYDLLENFSQNIDEIHGHGVDSVPSENEYQEHFLGVKAAGV